jgi:hypothetical protein
MNAITRIAAAVIALIALVAVLPAQAQVGAAGTGGTGRSTFNPSGDKPSWERERSSLAEDVKAASLRDLFTIKDMNFAFFDAKSGGQFVRQREDGAKEAVVRIESASGQMKRDLMVRAQCKDELFYFGPVSADAVPLKALEKGTVGELLFKQLCA